MDSLFMSVEFLAIFLLWSILPPSYMGFLILICSWICIVSYLNSHLDYCVNWNLLHFHVLCYLILNLGFMPKPKGFLFCSLLLSVNTPMVGYFTKVSNVRLVRCFLGSSNFHWKSLEWANFWILDLCKAYFKFYVKMCLN